MVGKCTLLNSSIHNDSHSDARIGTALVLAAAVAWSMMGLFVRMVPDASVWTVVFWRCTFGGFSVVALAMVVRRKFHINWKQTVSPIGILMAVLTASGILAGIYSMQNTTIANGCVIYSMVPFIAAILAWLWFNERPEKRTILSITVACIGVAITVSGTLTSGGSHWRGDLAMLYCAFVGALTTVMMRRYRDTHMLESVAMACLLAAAVSLAFKDHAAIPMSKVALLGLFGVVTVTGGIGLYTLGARYLHSAQATLLSSAEMPMSPLWVWIFFSEVPARETFIGGGLVLLAIVWNLRRGFVDSAAIRGAPDLR